MKKLDSVSVAFCCFLIAAILVISYGLVVASPFVVADPQPAEKYRIRLSADNGQTWGAWVEGFPISGAMRFDISGTPAGNYKGEAQAGATTTLTDSTSGIITTVFAWSTSSPFVLNVKTSQSVLNIRIIE